MTRLAQNIPGCINKAYYDMNPPPPMHWSYKQFILKQNPGDGSPLARPELYASFKLNPFDNLAHLPENYIADFLDTLPDRERARMRDGEFVSLVGVIYDEFDESMIIPASKVPPIEFYSVGVDFGLNSVGTLIGWSGENVYVLNETCLYNHTAAQLNGAIRDKNGDKKYIAYCDPSGGERLQEISFSFPANNSVEPGIDCIRKLMHNKNFFVVDTCRNTIDGIVTYRRDDAERIVKENDHEMDAMRYGIFSEKVKIRWGLA
jgi:phage terminase large subunit